MTISIPEQLKSKLPDGSYVFTLCANAERLFGLNAVYFAEYTKHNAEHANAVLRFVEKLIPPQTLEKLSQQAMEALIASAVFHDIGMFIQQDGLRELLFGAYAKQKTGYLDKQTWHEAWVDYYTQARRWGDRKLIEVFGDTLPVEHDLRDKLPDEMTDRHKLLYGEFLRRYHHRLAHDVALHGFFGNEQINVFKNCACDDFTKDLIGLLARSHGMAVRDTLPYLEQKHGEKKRAAPRGIPVLYLMVVLRIADYLHAGQERAPQEREQADRLRSSISHREYAWNQAVYDELDFDFGKKEVYVTAEPESSEVYQSLETWIRAIQQELDLCWAIIAEQYEYKYELAIHRIDINIFDENVLTGYNGKYLTRQAMLDANPDIVKHLVAPLYGDDPSYGVRELIQNAVDACNERDVIARECGESYEGLITVDINTETGIFTIADNGIGMNEDVLVNYYLVAGSSYRYSPVWAEKFRDEANKPKFARSGRFGIGALATFLLGEKAQVTTRYMDDELGLGYQFTYGLEPRVLDVKRVRHEIGTKIVIKMNINAARNLVLNVPDDYEPSLDFYHYTIPKIVYYVNNHQVMPRYYVSGAEGWYRCKDKHYDNVYWSYLTSDFLCNGLCLFDQNRGPAHKSGCSVANKGLKIQMPGISIDDPKQLLQLDLARSEIFNFDLPNFISRDLQIFLSPIFVRRIQSK